MSSEKYIGLDVHQATISAAVMDSRGKLVMESILETKAATALRSAQAACCQVSGVQPAQDRSSQTWQQKRQDRCP